MYFVQHYIDCLSQASYLIGDETSGQAVVVDPRRDIEDYLTDAADHGLSIVGVINTHIHADFVSGHLEMAAETGAWMGFGQAAQTDLDIRRLRHGERISLGDVTLEILETPGHTPESISVLVFEHAEDSVPYGVLTGDTLFIGDVGRPDLLASLGVTADELGRALYRSVQHILMSLPDQVRVFPAHGAGSACGKNLSTERQSTIGEQRALNYACQPMSEEAFVAVVTEGQPPAPSYFVFNATINRQDRGLRDLDERSPALESAQVDAELAAGAVLLDTRDPIMFAAGHLPGSVNVPADGRMAETVGMVLQPQQRIVVMADDGRHEEVVTRLARIGFDAVAGHVADPEGYLLSHSETVRPASRLTISQLTAAVATEDAQLVDIRNVGELEAGMVPGAVNIPLAQLAGRVGELDPARPVVVYCAGGWRSSVGGSLLRAKGLSDVSDLLGGYAAWASTHPQAS